MPISEQAARAVVRVGAGRGFVVRSHDRWESRLVITAAHCLPHLPTGFSVGYFTERTYRKLLGPLGGKATVWAECLFVDPVADLAVLGTPETQALGEQADAYDTLVEATEPLTVGIAAPAPGDPVRVSLLSKKGEWFACNATHNGGHWWLTGCASRIVGGMSGSPILDENGAAVGVVCASAVVGGQHAETLNTPYGMAGGNPRLGYHLPAGLLADLMNPEDC